MILYSFVYFFCCKIEEAISIAQYKNFLISVLYAICRTNLCINEAKYFYVMPPDPVPPNKNYLHMIRDCSLHHNDV